MTKIEKALAELEGSRREVLTLALATPHVAAENLAEWMTGHGHPVCASTVRSYRRAQRRRQSVKEAGYR